MRNTAILALLTASVVGIPWAIVRLVRWSLSTQAVILVGSGWREAGAVGGQSVIGRWWRTLLTLIVVGFIVTAIAPVAGILVLIFVNPSVFIANAVSGAVYALSFPFAGVVTSLWHLDRRGHAADAETEAVALNSADPAPAA